MFYNKKKKVIYIFSDGSLLITKSNIFNKLNFSEKDDRNSILWLKINETKNFSDKLNFRKKFLNKKK
jgi:hypothetical protein